MFEEQNIFDDYTCEVEFISDDITNNVISVPLKKLKDKYKNLQEKYCDQILINEILKLLYGGKELYVSEISEELDITSDEAYQLRWKLRDDALAFASHTGKIKLTKYGEGVAESLLLPRKLTLPKDGFTTVGQLDPYVNFVLKLIKDKSVFRWYVLQRIREEVGMEFTQTMLSFVMHRMCELEFLDAIHLRENGMWKLTKLGEKRRW